MNTAISRSSSRNLRVSVEPLECRIAPAFTDVIDLSMLDGANGYKLNGVADNYFAGHSVSDAGDVNGDGFGDVIVGAPNADDTGQDTGTTYVVFGKANGFGTSFNLALLDGTNGFQLVGFNDFDSAGVSVSGVGDVNGDTIDDLLIGGFGFGGAYVVFGKTGAFDATLSVASLDGNNGFSISGTVGIANVSSAGDVNNDGIADLIVGAGQSNAGGTQRGEAYVIFGSSSGFGADIPVSSLNGVNGFSLRGENNSDRAGTSVGSAGDVNGDGFDDVIIGAYFSDAGGIDSGASYVVFGKASGFAANISLSGLDGNNGFKLVGAASGDYAGVASGAGDVNGDGFSDIIIGAPGVDGTAGADSGAAYVFFGKSTGFVASVALSSLDGTTGFKISGETVGSTAGFSVSGAGDVDADTFDDLIVGSYGEAFVVFGRAAGFAADVSVSSLGGDSGIHFVGAGNTRISVSGAGDVNADGFADLIIGDTTDNGAGTDRGAAYVVFGAPTTDIDVELSSGNLTLSDTPGAFSDADLTVVLNGANIRITAPNFLNALNGVTQIDSHTVEIPLSSVVGLFTVDGGSGDDSLFIDYASTGENPLPAAGINFIGGSGGNTLSVGGSFTSGPVNVTHDLTAPNNGMISVDSTPIHYSGVTSIVDTLSIGGGNRVFNFTAASETIAFVSALDPFDLDTLTSSLGITIQSYRSSLTINANDGDDTITLEGAIGGVFRIDGQGGNDTIDFGNLTQGVILSAAAETIQPLPELLVVESVITTNLVRFKSDGGLSYYLDSSGPLVTSRTLHISGAVDFTGAALNVTTSLQAVPSAPITLVDIPGTTPATGIFDGLPEGSTVPISVSGAETIAFIITYRGGDGNDVQLIANPLLPIGVVNLSLLNGTTGFRTFGGSDGDGIGQTVSSAGDVNGDGVEDFLIGAAGTDISSNADAGACYVVFGKAGGFSSIVNLSTLDGTNGFKITGAASGSRLGTSASKLGDVNGDGVDDILISALDDAGVASETHVVFGSTNFSSAVLSVSALNGSNGFSFQSASFISGASAAGDVNGDGIGDILVGNSGVCVVFGRGPASPFSAIVDPSNLNGSNGFKVDDVFLEQDFGRTVSSAGDVNGDGFDDILIGTAQSPTSGTYVIFGKASGFSSSLSIRNLNGTNGFKINGDDFSYSVGAAGDMNGDGLSDIVIGSFSSSRAGYVIFGKTTAFKPTFELSTLDGKNGFALGREHGNDGAGTSISGIGDFNADGYDDFIIAAPQSEVGRDFGVFTTGASYLVFGRPGGFSPTLELATLNGTTGVKFIAEGGYTSTASGAGDVNGDGIPDIIIGTTSSNIPSTGTGSVYVVYGNDDFHKIPESNKSGNTLKFTDGDGDLVTITVSKGTLSPDMLTFGPEGGLFKVDLTIPGSTIKNGANLTFSVEQVPGGDGALDVGAIDATGLSLGKVKVTGNLGQIDIGSDVRKNALKSLTVASLGSIIINLHPPGTIDPFTSDIVGGLPNLTINGNVNLAQINVDGKLGTITVEGDAIGTDIAIAGSAGKLAIKGDMNHSRIYATGHVKTLNVGGDMIGFGAFTPSQMQGLAELGYPVVAPTSGGITFASTTYKAPSTGRIDIAGKMRSAGMDTGDTGTVTTGGMTNSSLVATRVKVVKVFEGGITSDDLDSPSVISVKTALDELTVNGDVKNALIVVGYSENFAPTESDARVGKVFVKGSWTASSLTAGVADFGRDGFGQGDRPIFAGLDGTGADQTPRTISKIGSVIINGIAKGSDGVAGDFFGITAQQIGKTVIYNISAILGTAANSRGELTIAEDFHIVEV